MSRKSLSDNMKDINRRIIHNTLLTVVSFKSFCNSSPFNTPWLTTNLGRAICYSWLRFRYTTNSCMHFKITLYNIQESQLLMVLKIINNCFSIFIIQVKTVYTKKSRFWLICGLRTRFWLLFNAFLVMPDRTIDS